MKTNTNMENEIIQGDALKELKKLPSEFVSCIMTSPPYWALRDYGTEGQIWDADANCEHEFKIKENKNSADRQGHSEKDNGKYVDWEDTQNPNYSGKCLKCKAWKGSLGLEPTFELYIKHLCDIFDEAKRVLRKDGTCWINLGDTYGGSNGVGWKETIENTNRKIGGGENKSIKKELGIEVGVQKSLCNIPARFSIEMQNRGWILRNVIIWHKPNCMPSSVKDRFTVDFEYLFFFVKNKNYWFETQYDNLESTCTRKRYSTFRQQRDGENSDELFTTQGRNKRAVWTICPRPFKEAHFAVYPEELCETPIKAGCPEFICKKCGKAREKILEPTAEYAKHLGQSWHNHSDDKGMGFGQQTRGFSSRKGNVNGIQRYNEKGFTICSCNAGFEGGIVLDPFFGAGTTGLVALKQNKRFIGVELQPKYIEIAMKRLKPYLEQTKLKGKT